MELLASRATRTPERAAFLEGAGVGSATERAASWGQIARRAEDLAKELGPGDTRRRLGLCIDGASEYCSTYLGALAWGFCVVPLDPRAPAGEIWRAVEELGLTDILIDAPMAGLAGPMLGSGVNIWCVGEQAGAARRLGGRSVASVHRASVRRALVPPGGFPSPTGVAVLLRSSGSTGRPKIIPLTQFQLLYNARGLVGHHRLTPADRGYCPLPLFHINAQVVGILGTLVSGGSLVVDRRLARGRFWDTVECSGATWLNLVPAILAIAGEGSLTGEWSSRIRFARSASSHLAEPIRRRFEAATGISVLETYGMTEAAGQITANPLEPDRRRPGSVGLPVGVELRLRGDDGTVVSEAGRVGEVQIKGPSVIADYLNPWGSTESLVARSPDGWLSSGDLAWQDSDGFVFLMGRTDDLINRGGEKLYPAEIETVLLSDPRVLTASAVGRPHPTLGAEPVAFVVPRPDALESDARGSDALGLVPGNTGGADRLIQDLHRVCEARLSFYKRPVEITLTDQLPMGATGKIARARVRDLVAGRTVP